MPAVVAVVVLDGTAVAILPVLAVLVVVEQDQLTAAVETMVVQIQVVVQVVPAVTMVEVPQAQQVVLV
jgi:hypothetical protein